MEDSYSARLYKTTKDIPRVTFLLNYYLHRATHYVILYDFLIAHNTIIIVSHAIYILVTRPPVYVRRTSVCDGRLTGWFYYFSITTLRVQLFLSYR